MRIPSHGTVSSTRKTTLENGSCYASKSTDAEQAQEKPKDSAKAVVLTRLVVRVSWGDSIWRQTLEARSRFSDQRDSCLREPRNCVSHGGCTRARKRHIHTELQRNVKKINVFLVSVCNLKVKKNN